ncbi:MAG: PilN domain-containing protein [Candidatus Omnitrophota bacterium]
MSLLEKKGLTSSKAKGPNAFERFMPVPVTLVVSLGVEYLKIGCGRMSQGKFMIEGVAAEKIENKSDSDIALILASYCEQQKITPSQGLCVISPKQYIFKNIDIPSTEKEEIAKIIDLQAGRFTPYMRDEIVIDFLCLEAPAQHYTSVLLFIVNRKIGERFPSIFEQAGLSLDRVIVASECMARTYVNSLRGVTLQGALGGLHVSEEYSELTVMEGEQIVFVRNIPVGAEALRSNPQQAKEDFIGELNKSIGAYADQGVGRPIQLISATGLLEELPALGDDLKRSGSSHAKEIEVVSFDYRDYFYVGESAMRVVNQESKTSFFELFSVLAYESHAKINLLLREVKIKRQVREGGRDILSLGILIMAVFFLTTLIMGSNIYFKKLVNQKLEVASRQYGEEAKKLESVSTKNRIVKKLLESRGKELQVLKIINGFVGDDLYFSLVNYDNDGHVSLTGTAGSMSRVFSFVTQLRDSNHFSSVETKETKSRKEGKQDVADFVIECILAPGF